MIIIEPHIHMYSRTTDDYQAMYSAGIRACVEPSFWLGSARRYAGSFFDYFQLILDFETIRAERFGIDHYAAVSMNPKEAENKSLAREVIEGMINYINHPRCIAIGEIGFNNITANEQWAFEEQLNIAKKMDMLIIVHLPHFNKLEGTKRSIDIIKSSGISPEKIILDHNTEETIELSLNSGCWAGLTVYPISKLNPERAAKIVKKYGVEHIIINGSADWGVSDPLSLPKVANFMYQEKISEAWIKTILFDNPVQFYNQSGKWKGRLNLVPVDPKEFQR